MPLYAVTVEGEFTTKVEADAALSDMEEAIAKNNGYLRNSQVEDEDAEEDAEEDEEVPESDFCEDYPCCGHAHGDCRGQKYGSDESIKAAAYERMRMEDEGYFFQGEE